MRKIEKEMTDAIMHNSDWKKDNTEVSYCVNGSHVYVYDDHIATIGETYVILHAPTIRSKTVKSRINAILETCGSHPGEKVFSKNGVWYIQYFDRVSNKMVTQLFTGISLY